MISSSILEAQKELYEKGRQEAMANVNAFSGAIEAIDSLLAMCDQYDEATKEKEEAEVAE